jgi:hypothetical protein
MVLEIKLSKRFKKAFILDKKYGLRAFQPSF